MQDIQGRHNKAKTANLRTEGPFRSEIEMVELGRKLAVLLSRGDGLGIGSRGLSDSGAGNDRV
jgi:hypothetical protein